MVEQVTRATLFDTRNLYSFEDVPFGEPNFFMNMLFKRGMVMDYNETVHIENRDLQNKIAKDTTGRRGYEQEEVGSRNKLSMTKLWAQFQFHSSAYDYLGTTKYGQEVNIPVDVAENFQDKLMNQDIPDGLRMMGNRVEKVISDIVQTGSYSSARDGITRNFERNSELTNVYDSSINWAGSNVNILNFIRDDITTVTDNKGFKPNVMVLGTTVADAILNSTNEDLYRLFDTRRLDLGELNVMPMDNQQARFLGTLFGGELQVYEYLGVYEDDSGTITKFFPEKGMCMFNSNRQRVIECGQVPNFEAPSISHPYIYIKETSNLIGDVKFINFGMHYLPVFTNINDVLYRQVIA